MNPIAKQHKTIVVLTFILIIKMFKKPPLYAFHKNHGGKMVSFAGWSMPLQYAGIFDEHLHTRKKIGLFDVTHMGQVKFYGNYKDDFLEYLFPCHIKSLKNDHIKVSVMLNDNGCIKDDCLITKREKYNHITVNACNYDKDIDYFQDKLKEFGKDVKMEICDEMCMLALQGPMAFELLQKYISLINNLYFLQCLDTTIKGIPVQINRCGYTGEDGFEIIVHRNYIENLVSIFMLDKNVKLVGLGARDTLRIEAGMCLYGHEINEDINLIEAGLSWILGKGQSSFIGYDAIQKIKENKNLILKKRIGIIMPAGPCARENVDILSLDNQIIGKTTSGCPSPSLSCNIAQGYVKCDFINENAFKLVVRGKEIIGKPTKMPFIKAKYHRET